MSDRVGLAAEIPVDKAGVESKKQRSMAETMGAKVPHASRRQTMLKARREHGLGIWRRAAGSK
jgi:hypothetical protein